MGKTYKLNTRYNINIDVSGFNQLISSPDVKTNDEIDQLIITLSQGTWCQINPGISFEILEYNKSSDAPGYITPVGNGCCDIYSENGDTTIKVVRYADKDASFGICNGKTYGPFKIEDIANRMQSSVLYFNHQSGNFIDRVGDNEGLNFSRPSCHLLMVVKNITWFINDAEPNAYKKFIGRVHWRDVYANQFIILGDTLNVQKDYVTDIENIDISKRIPEESKITKFVCRTTFDSGNVGVALTLSNEKKLKFKYDHPESDCTCLPIGNSVHLFLPRLPPSKMLVFARPDSLLADHATVIGLEEVARHYYMNNIEFFPRKSASLDDSEEASLVLEGPAYRR